MTTRWVATRPKQYSLHNYKSEKWPNWRFRKLHKMPSIVFEDFPSLRNLTSDASQWCKSTPICIEKGVIFFIAIVAGKFPIRTHFMNSLSLHRLPRIAWEASKKIQKTHKSKILCSGWMQDMEKWFGRWDATHLIHDASLDSSVNGNVSWHRRNVEAHASHIIAHMLHLTTKPYFCNANVSWHRRNVEAHASHIIPHMLHLTTKPYFSHNGETVHIDTC